MHVQERQAQMTSLFRNISSIRQRPSNKHLDPELEEARRQLAAQREVRGTLSSGCHLTARSTT